MKIYFYSVMVILCLSFLYFAGCNTKNNDRNDERSINQKKSELIEKVQNTITSIDKKIAGLSGKSSRGTEDTKTAVNNRLNELRAKKDELQKKLDDIRNKSSDNWEDFKSDVNRSLSDAKETLNIIETDINTRIDSLSK